VKDCGDVERLDAQSGSTSDTDSSSDNGCLLEEAKQVFFSTLIHTGFCERPQSCAGLTKPSPSTMSLMRFRGHRNTSSENDVWRDQIPIYSNQGRSFQYQPAMREIIQSNCMKPKKMKVTKCG